jgi:glycogen debranching enzyme
LVLGERLPEAIRKEMIEQVRAFLTEWGPATEAPGTPRYEPEGYWRGPIWGPSTLILADGLRRSGAPELAHEIGLKYCRLCRKSGFSENFNAVTGEPLRDPAYTWTSSVFLTLAREFLQEGDK